MSHVLEKVFLLKQLNLPLDMIEEINGMCFYDREATNTRTNMRNILEVIKSPILNGFDEKGHWCFWADEIQFQGSNCLKCGNYIRNSIIITRSNTRLLCNCHNR